MRRVLQGLLFLFLLATAKSEEAVRPTPGTFAPLEKAKSYRGELVFVDHVNRRGSLRLHVDGHFEEGPLHHFAMLPYGVIRYRGAPAALQDIPLGTVLYGNFFLPPDPKASLVPVVGGKGGATRKPENYAILLEDGPSLCLREGKAWKLKEVEIKDGRGLLVATLDRKDGGDGLGGEHKITVDGSTRIWRGKELISLGDLVAEGVWPSGGKKPMNGQAIQLGLTWHPKYLYQQFHAADLWLDEASIKRVTEQQRQKHLRHVRHRWMPARVIALEHDKFGKGIVTATLFGGMDPDLYADFKPNTGGKMAAAEETLRTWWQDHDGMDGRIIAVEKKEGAPVFGDSGITIRFQVPLLLEGFRPGRIVRIRAQGWPNVKPPSEERVKRMEDRWPGTEVFER